MTRKQLVAEILTDLKKYDDLGLVDLRTVNLTIKNELKRFGSNICEIRQGFIDIMGGKSKLPDGFYRLKSAYLIKGFDIDCQDEVDDLWRVDTYVTRIIENEYGWSNMSESHYKKSYKEVIEEKLIRGSRVYIKNNIVDKVTLSKGISKDYLSYDCINNEIESLCGVVITINNSTITSNTKECRLFITYESLPEEDGELVIPDLPNLINYLIHKVKHKILEGIWVNDEADTVAQKVSYFNQKATEYWLAACTEVKFNGLSPNFSKKLREANRKELRKFYK